MIWLWLSFVAAVGVLLALDLGVFHRKAHEVSMKEAGVWTAVWIGLALAFTVFVFFLYQHNLFGVIGPGQPKGYEAAVLGEDLAAHQSTRAVRHRAVHHV